MNKTKISAVSYLNAKPFIYGLQHSPIIKKVTLALDIPSVCAQKLMDGTVAVGLVPVAVIPHLKEHYIISDYCIGAEGKVASVMLYSNVPLAQISEVLLDYQSRTSVTLVQVLAANLWKINPKWTNAAQGYENQVKDTTAAVIIGDRNFGLERKYQYSYDLAEEWQKLTGLPFVFACWVANKKLSQRFINDFNVALKFGLDNRLNLVSELSKSYPATDVANYLYQSIQYTYDAPKKKALNLFLDYLSKL